MASDFDELVSEAAAVDVSGWDFSWLAGRAIEERPSWGYARQLAHRLAHVDRAVDLDTGGGEVLNEAEVLPTLTVATEAWPPNRAKAARLLEPRGVTVVAAAWPAALPFRDASFDLVTSRHPIAIQWSEVARVLAPGGSYFAQHVGPASAVEVTEWFLGPQPDAFANRTPQDDRDQATAAGLTVTDQRSERLRMRFFDVGAVVYFLRKVIWIVPGFTAEKYLPQLKSLHDHIGRNGVFEAHSARTMIEAVKR